MTAEIVSVGTELLLGSIVNKNAATIAGRLSECGIKCFRQTTVGDNPRRLEALLEEIFKRADMIIATGGLGPTRDDITKEIACRYLGMPMEVHEESLEQIKGYLHHQNRELSPENLKQAYFPKEAIVLKNEKGTAPGCILEKAKKRIILLPGPPLEMEPMLEESVMPYLRKFHTGIYKSRTIRLIGIGESTLARQLRQMIDHQTNPTIALYAGEGEASVRITAAADDESEALALIRPVEEEITNSLAEYIYGYDEQTLESRLVNLLTRKKLTIATAESCTGGLLSSRIVDCPGASNVFMGGFITYSNAEKIKRLDVSPKTLEKHGAVSSRTAVEMARGAAHAVDTDIGIATTGIAGPSGGTPEKPVGTVFIGLYYRGQSDARRFLFKGDRKKVRLRTYKHAIKLLLDTLS